MIELSSEVTGGFMGPGLNNFFFSHLETEIFLTKTVGELISGYHDPLLYMANQILPSIVKNEEFSLMNGVNSLNILFL